MTAMTKAAAGLGWGWALLLLAGCASVPIEQGRDQVATQLAAGGAQAMTLPRAGENAWDAAVAARLDAPLRVEDAVAIAWSLSPEARAALAELGLAAADAFDARRIGNPGLSLARLGSGGERETTLGLHLPLGDLLLLPARRRIGEAQWRADIAETVQALRDQAAEVGGAYYEALAAQQVAAMREAVAEATAISAELAARFHAAGNISALQLAREQANASSARHAAAMARAERLSTRMRLAELMGLAGRSNRWSLPDRLPLPAAGEIAVDTLLEQARSQRADLAAARARLEAREAGARLTRRTGWIGEVELGVEREKEGDEHRHGVELGIELPLFSQGQGLRARAEARRELALQRIAGIELAIEQEVRSGVARLQTLAAIIDSYRTALIPQQQAIVAREQERYNFMLIGVFELLQARREEFDGYQHYFEAIRDFWLAHGALEKAIGGPLPWRVDTTPVPTPEQIITPAGEDAGSHHLHHGGQP